MATDHSLLWKKQITVLRENVVIMDDFNYVAWETLVTEGLCNRKFLNCFNSNFVSTCYKANKRQQHFGQEQNIVSNMEVGQTFSTSDHQVVGFTIDFRITEQQREFLERCNFLEEVYSLSKEDDYRNEFGECVNRKNHRGKLEHVYHMYVESLRIDITPTEENNDNLP